MASEDSEDTDRRAEQFIFALEQKSSIQILLFLFLHGSHNLSEIFRSGLIKSGQTAFYRAISRLEQAGLISSTQRSPRTPRLLSLTELGHHVAERLYELVVLYISFSE